jgi:hypothetical protein
MHAQLLQYCIEANRWVRSPLALELCQTLNAKIVGRLAENLADRKATVVRQNPASVKVLSYTDSPYSHAKLVGVVLIREVGLKVIHRRTLTKIKSNLTWHEFGYGADGSFLDDAIACLTRIVRELVPIRERR